MSRRERHQQEEEESVFVSMTDIMVGLLFIFLMIIMYFAIQTQRQQEIISSIPEGELMRELVDYQSEVEQQRSLILTWIGAYLEDSGITGVEIIQDQGIIRLPEGILFDPSQFSVEEGSSAFLTATTLSEALASILPCSSLDSLGSPYRERSVCRNLPNTEYPNRYDAFVQGVYIEGHTDNDPVNPETGLAADPRITSNLKLAARRSTNTFEILLSHRSELLEFHGPVSTAEALRFEPVLASSAYGEYRPAVPNISDENKRANRRIDIRVVMYQPINAAALNQLFDYVRERIQ